MCTAITEKPTRLMSQQLVVSNNNAQKLKANVKRDKRKLLKHVKKTI